MANQKISQLTESTTPGDNDLIPMVVGGVTVKVKKSALLQAVTTALSGKLDKPVGMLAGNINLNTLTESKIYLLYTLNYAGLNYPDAGAPGWNGNLTVFADTANTDVVTQTITRVGGDAGVPGVTRQWVRGGHHITTAPVWDNWVETTGYNKADKDLSINTQTASYTLALSDRAGLVRMNVASANTLTVPPNSAVAFPIGTQIVLTQAGAGQTTIVAGSGVTINASAAKMKLNGQWSGATLIQVSANQWTLLGDLTA